jgi:hypothetical protein
LDVSGILDHSKGTSKLAKRLKIACSGNTDSVNLQCPNGNSFRNQGGQNASDEWQGVFLEDTTARINSLIEGFNFTWKDVYAMQTMCPYELVRLIQLAIHSFQVM